MVGISLLTLVPGVVCGSETYARELCRALARTGELEYVVFATRLAPRPGAGRPPRPGPALPSPPPHPAPPPRFSPRPELPSRRFVYGRTARASRLLVAPSEYVRGTLAER